MFTQHAQNYKGFAYNHDIVTVILIQYIKYTSIFMEPSENFKKLCKEKDKETLDIKQIKRLIII